MADRAPSSLVSILAAFLAGAAGGFLGSQLWSTSSHGGEPGGRGERDALVELNAHMKDLAGELRRLSEREISAADRAPAQSSPRESAAAPAPGKNPNKDEVLAAIDRLTVAIAAMGAGHGPSGSAPLVAPATAQTKRVADLAALVRREGNEVVSRDYFFLTYQQVLDRFGRPTSIYARDAHVRFEYEIANPEPDGAHTLVFVFVDGYVIQLET